MIPILFNANATQFNNFGIGHLPDAISPHVVEERNGEFTFEMQYPIDGEHYSDIQLRSIICAKPSPEQSKQPFRVYRISKPINGIVTVSARNVRYDLEGIPVAPFTASGISQALQKIKQNSLVTNPFTFTTDKTNTQTMTLEAPAPALSLLGGVHGSLLDVYGGEYKYNGFTINLLGTRGTDKGVVIRYGVDLIDLQQEENCAEVYTGVLCFWKSTTDSTLVTGEIQNSGTFDYTRVKVVDKSTDYEEAPTVARLNQDAVNYINNNKVGVPKVSLNVRFANLEQTEEYENIRQSIELCDQITVKFEKLGVSAMAKVIRTDFDVMNERYISVDIGDHRSSLADSVVSIQAKAESAPTTTEMQQAINATTAAITGANGGAVRLLDTNDDGLPDTLYIADNASPLLAQKVWRFNYEGWGASEQGYAGPFTMGATFQAGFIADFITAGTLNANRIGANSIAVSKLTGKITGGLESSWELNLTDGTLKIGNISAANITAGTLDADRISAGTIGLAKFTSDAQAALMTSSSTTTQYYLSTSASSATGGSWSSTIPTWTSGKYLWTRTATTKTFADNTTSTTYLPQNGAYDKNLTTALSTASSASSAASSANSMEQLIYISKASGTNTVPAPTPWITNDANQQNTWTLRRPTYNSSYPVLFIATQRKTVGGTITCTTPVKDETTTVIDGGHITTGTIDASRVTVTNLNASNITSGTLDASTITVSNLNADNITTGSINGQRITDGTIEGAKIGKGEITGGVDIYGRPTGNLAALSITGANLANSTIDGAKIGKGAITGGTDAYGRPTGNLASLTITGSNIANTTLPGDKLVDHTLGDLQISQSSLSTASLSGGINTSLGYADNFNLSTTKGLAQNKYPQNFTAGDIDAFKAFYSGSYKVREQGEVAYDLTGHYHDLKLNSEGKIEIGPPQKDKPVPFEYGGDGYDHASVLATNSSNYTTYDTGYSIGNNVYNPNASSGGLSTYARLGLYKSDNSLIKTLRLAMSVSVTRGDYPQGEQYWNAEKGHYIPYYKYVNNTGYVRAVVKIGTTEVTVGDIEVNMLVTDCIDMGGGGGNYSYDWSDEKTGPYGSKQRDCYFRVNGNIVQTAKVIWSSGNPSFQ